jgi:hypothetical protein
MREDAFADQSREATQKDARGDQPCASGCDGLRRALGGILIDDGIVPPRSNREHRASDLQRLLLRRYLHERSHEYSDRIGELVGGSLNSRVEE